MLVDDRGVAFVHRLLKERLEVPAERIATVVVPHPGPDDERVALRREPRHLDLVTHQYAPPNGLIVFDPPLRIDRFRYGAHHVLAVSRRERKEGVDVDSIGVTLDDPDGLTAAMARLGVRVERAVTQTYVRLIGQAFGEDRQPDGATTIMGSSRSRLLHFRSAVRRKGRVRSTPAAPGRFDGWPAGDDGRGPWGTPP